MKTKKSPSRAARWLKRSFAGLVLLLLIVTILLGKTIYDFGSGVKPVADGVELTAGARTIKAGDSSAFLLAAGNDQVALVDCGSDVKGRAILAELARRQLRPESVKAVFITHAHPDHIAACHLFKSAEVYAFEPEALIAMGKARARGPMPWLIGTPESYRVHVTKLLTDGATVSVGTLQVKVYLVSGHTAGNAVFLVNQTLYAGDSLVVQADGSLDTLPWIFSDSVAQSARSIKQLAVRLLAEEAGVSKIAPAHSGAVDGIQPLLDFASRN